MSGHKNTNFYEFREGTPIAFTYTEDYIYTIIKENSYVYIATVYGTWYIECYTKVQYSNDTTINVNVFYI